MTDQRRYSQFEIDDLIGCAKAISDPPKRDLRLDRGHFRNDMRVESVDGSRAFRVFMRRSEDFPENFSVGLVFLPRDGSGELVLLRCNGPHGEYNDSFDADHPHWDFHVHRASAEMIEAGERPEKRAASSQEFASYEEAVQYFLSTANVTDAAKHFDMHVDTQGSLPFAGPEPKT